MPLPEPHDDETKDEFISRCMGDDTMIEDFPDEDQRAGVCNTIWDDKDESSAHPETERRILSAEDVELRVEGGKDKPAHIIGYAARFNKDSVDLGWGGMKVIEQIAPGAFKEALKDSDVRALKNHDPNLLLGREPTTLQLTENSRGLKFDVTAPDTTTGRDTVEEVRRGDITGCSFSFTVKSDTWDERDDGMYRTINEFSQIFDVGPVTFPAYPDTTVSARDVAGAKRSLETWRAVKEGIEDVKAGRVSDGPDMEAAAKLVEQIEADETPNLDAARARLIEAKEAEAQAERDRLQAILEKNIAKRAKN